VAGSAGAAPVLIDQSAPMLSSSAVNAAGIWSVQVGKQHRLQLSSLQAYVLVPCLRSSSDTLKVLRKIAHLPWRVSLLRWGAKDDAREPASSQLGGVDWAVEGSMEGAAVLGGRCVVSVPRALLLRRDVVTEDVGEAGA
jgi:hypothetical protein